MQVCRCWALGSCDLGQSRRVAACAGRDLPGPLSALDAELKHSSLTQAAESPGAALPGHPLVTGKGLIPQARMSQCQWVLDTQSLLPSLRSRAWPLGLGRL